MKFLSYWRQLIIRILILTAIAVMSLHVAFSKPYIAKNEIHYKKVWHANGSVTLNLFKDGQHFAYHANPEIHQHGNPIYQIKLENVLCKNHANCIACNPTQEKGAKQ